MVTLFISLLRMKFTLLIIIITLQACSLFNKSDKNSYPALVLPKKRYANSGDFIDHLAALETAYINTPNVKMVRLSNTNKKYLDKIVSEITSNNEELFKNMPSVTIKIVKHSTPFYFALPKGKIFLSSGLIAKYICDDEDYLAIIFSQLMLQSSQNIYYKNIIIPTGYIRIERLLSLVRITLKERIKLHKWSHYLLTRTRFDASQYLSWIQLQNKNALDFVMLYGDIKSISREESMFKSFIVDRGSDLNLLKKRTTSSKEFYTFLKQFKKKDRS